MIRNVLPHIRNLVVVLGDQLDERSSAFDGFNRNTDVVWMAEVRAEVRHVHSHQVRIAVLLSAMRHFRDALVRRRVRVEYSALDDPETRQGLSEELCATVRRLRPGKLILVEPGEYRVREVLQRTARQAQIALDIRQDRHFLASRAEFDEYAKGRKQLRMEHFYRFMRRRHGVLMNGDRPRSGQWNLDAQNRDAFKKDGPGKVPPPRRFPPDRTTRQVLELVRTQFPNHPGRLEDFDWPVTKRQAAFALRDFIEHRLPRFGRFQDAMWAGEPYLFHARLSSAMNLKLLEPLEAIRAAEETFLNGSAPLNAVEGFIRQILGWREYVRGVYWRHMPEYERLNRLNAEAPLPWFYWTGDTEMACLREVIGQTLRLSYAHHIQRLMVTGLFAMLLGVDPVEVHRWYLAIYADAVEWVEMPNVLGMSQFADGGLMASKPYAATGKYIRRMSNYCVACPYDPDVRAGEKACPFTVLYWDFLSRHQKTLARNARMGLQIKNLIRLDRGTLKEIRRTARRIRDRIGRTY